ncbi:desulfoferrodoxin [Candidatus Woesearchaeota archaeon]|nr:desulfoferrodoxin [Candidatus Woesearchaeota archaeon]
MGVKELNEVYKCSMCGNIVETVHVGGGDLVCCGKPMILQQENTTDAAEEKHVPIIKKTDNGFKVKVGEVPHPMEESHFIEWIELIADGISYKKFLKPGDTPEAVFCVSAEDTSARAFCNLHGLWKSG